MRRDDFLKTLAALAAAGTLPARAAGANLKMMIPANPGGGWDTTGRALGKALQEAGVAASVSYDNYLARNPLEDGGAPIGVMETISYYTIIATAGHDTTASSIMIAVAARGASSKELRCEVSGSAPPTVR